jgi:hypothetical protein
MRYLPGYGANESLEASTPSKLSKFSNRLEEATRRVDRSIKKRWDRTEEARGTNLYLDRPAMDWYEPLGFKREFGTPGGGIKRHLNAVDAFRHAYTSGMTNDWIVGIATWTEKEDSAGNMDRKVNEMGLKLYEDFEKWYGRSPTEAEFADEVLGAILDGRIPFDKNNGEPGWEGRMQEDLNKRLDERQDKLWQERQDRAQRTNRGDAYAPRELEKFRDYQRERPDRFDRFEGRPGFGDDRRMLA